MVLASIPTRAKDMEEFVTYQLPIKDDFLIEFVRWKINTMQWCYKMNLRGPYGSYHLLKKSPTLRSFHAEKYSFASFKHSLEDFLDEHADVNLKEVYL